MGRPTQKFVTANKDQLDKISEEHKYLIEDFLIYCHLINVACHYITTSSSTSSSDSSTIGSSMTSSSPGISDSKYSSSTNG